MSYVPISRSRYRVSVGGNDVSDRIAPYLIQLQVTDKEGTTSDSARITLDDEGGRFQNPQKGDPVSIMLGNDARGLVQKFEGIVDTVRSQYDRGGGQRLEISAKAQDNTSGIKDPKQKHKDDATLQEVADEFGKAGGLEGITVHQSLASLRRPYWAMDGESILAWGRRVAREVGGTFKIVGKRGIIVPRSAGLSASGKTLSTVMVRKGENLISCDIAPDTARPQYEKVIGRYYDVKLAKWVEKEVSVENSKSSGRVQRTRFSQSDDGEAEKAAGGEGKDIDHDRGGGRVDIDGDPTITAGSTCIISGIKPGVDGSYIIDSVTDTLERGRGYVTSLEVAKPKV